VLILLELRRFRDSEKGVCLQCWIECPEPEPSHFGTEQVRFDGSIGLLSSILAKNPPIALSQIRKMMSIDKYKKIVLDVLALRGRTHRSGAEFGGAPMAVWKVRWAGMEQVRDAGPGLKPEVWRGTVARASSCPDTSNSEVKFLVWDQ
jgi:hypothetical protein